MKYLAASVISAMVFFAMFTPAINVNFWQKLLYNKEDAKEKKKKEYKAYIIIWAVFTVVEFIYITFFYD